MFHKIHMFIWPRDKENMYHHSWQDYEHKSLRISVYLINDVNYVLKWCCAEILLTFRSSGTSILRAFLIMGWGLSSSSLKRCLRGSNASCPGTLDSATSAGSGSKDGTTSLQLVLGGVGSGGHEVEDGEGVGSKLPGGVPEGRHKVDPLIKSRC